MNESKTWLIATAATFASSVLAQIATWDAAAAAGYISVVGLASIAVYTKFREVKRDQNMRDREAEARMRMAPWSTTATTSSPSPKEPPCTS
jgi:hypothetical protein